MVELINDAISVTLPDGFRAMSADELKRGYGTDFEHMRGFWDEARHVIFTVTWNESSKFMLKLTSADSLAKRAEKHLSRAYKGLGYRCNGFFNTQVAGQAACGVGYSYAVQGVAHDAEAIVFLFGSCCYTLYYYTHSEDAVSNAELRDQLLAKVTTVL